LARAFEKANVNSLVGDWRRMRQAGLEDQIPSYRELLAEFGA
jgi:hypothetical protein